MSRRQVEVNKRTNQITFETEYFVRVHGTDIELRVGKFGVKLREDVVISDAETLEDYALAMSKAWAQYLKVRPKIEVVSEVPEIYEESTQKELPGILT